MYHMQRREACLEQKRNLLWLAYDDLGRSSSEKAFQRSGQMGLISIASLVNGVEDGNPFRQEGCCAMSAFNLPNCLVTYPGCLQEAILHGTRRQHWRLSLQHS